MEKEQKDTAPRKVKARSTRAELLKAYQAAQEKLEQLSSGRTPSSGKDAAEQALEKALAYTDENVIRAIADLQVAVGKALKDLTTKMIAESNKLADLRTASDLEKSKLKELHDINYQASTFAALIESQSEQKKVFEEEMTNQRKTFEIEMESRHEEWRKEQQVHETTTKDRDLLLKKQRERDEEEYAYRLQVERKKESALYETKKAKLEQELSELRENVEKEVAERRSSLAAQETELVELRKRVERFPKELDEAVKKTEAAVRVTMKQQHDYETKLAEKDLDAERKVNGLKVNNLEETVARQQAQIVELTKQLQAATRQVQEMAVKAIESAAGAKGRAQFDESTSDQKKNG